MKRITLFPNGAYVTYEKLNGWHAVQARGANGEIIDKVRCDDYREAQAYYRSFKLLAKQS